MPGTLQASRIAELGFGEASRIDASDDIAQVRDHSSRTLVALERPINSLHVSEVHGALASASDAEVLTFLDLRR